MRKIKDEGFKFIRDLTALDACTRGKALNLPRYRDLGKMGSPLIFVPYDPTSYILHMTHPVYLLNEVEFYC